MLAGVAAIALGLTACAGDGGDGEQSGGDEDAAETGDEGVTSEETAEGGELDVAMGALPPMLDPVQYNTPPNNFVQDLLFSTVTKIDSSGDETEVGPGVAESWEQLDDTTWQFTIREGLEFPNGEPLDAEAVAWTAEYVLDPDNQKPMASRINTISEIEAIDATTLEVTTDGPDAILPSRMGALAVLPPEAVEEQGEDFYLDPIGTGPFAVEEFQAEQRLVLTPNESAIGEQPVLDRVTLEVIPEAGSRVSALRAGDVDVIHRLPTEQIESLESDGLVVTAQVESGTYNLTAIQEEGPLAEQEVRQAINYAINREALNEQILAGLGEPASQMSNPGFTGHIDDIEPFEHDPERARELLAEAGYEDGVEVDFQASSGFLVNDATLAEAIAGMLSDVGIEANLQIMEYGTFLDAFFTPEARDGIFAWRASNNPYLDAELGLQFFESDNAVHSPPYGNSEYDELLEQIRTELDKDARDELIREATEILREEAPVIMVLHLPDVWGMSEEVANFPIQATGVPVFESVTFGG